MHARIMMADAMIGRAKENAWNLITSVGSFEPKPTNNLMVKIACPGFTTMPQCSW